MAPRALATLCALAAALVCPASGVPVATPQSTEDTSALNSIETQPDSAEDPCPPLVARAEWGAAPPKLVERQKGAAPFVIVHHTYQPGACNSSESCAAAMRSMQHFHQDTRGWNDIGYSFVVGGDGRVYVGRGWRVVGAHAPRFNNRSIGISFIGDYVESPPPAFMTALAQRLIACSVWRGELVADYRLLGHRQVRNTQCPGDAFYQQVRRWPHWVPRPDANLTSSSPTPFSLSPSPSSSLSPSPSPTPSPEAA